MKNLLLIFTFLLTPAAQAGELSAASKVEIEHLFQHLGSSGCQFNRNGSWYSASEATAHIKKKYDYFLNKGSLTSAETFIDLAAKESSMTHRPYEVKCEGQASIQSAVWFNAELKKFRSVLQHL